MALNPKEPLKPVAEKPTARASENTSGKSAKSEEGLYTAGAKSTAANQKKTAKAGNAKADIMLPKNENMTREAEKKVKEKAGKTAQPKAEKATKAQRAAKATAEPKPAKQPPAKSRGTAERVREPKSASASAKNAATVAKGAASAAREAARTKREAVHKSPPLGSIYAAALKQGEAQSEPMCPRQDTAGGIYAAAVRSGTVQPQPYLSAGPSITLAETENAQGETYAPSGNAENAVNANKTLAAPVELEADADASDAEKNETAGLLNTASLPAFGRRGKAAGGQAPKKKKHLPKLRAQTPFGKQVARVLNLPPLKAVGGFLYLFGFAAECKVLQIYRFLRDVFVFAFQLLGWVLGGVFRAVWAFLRSAGQDLAEPFVRFKAGLANTRRVMEEEKKKVGGNPAKAAVAYFKDGVKSHSHLVGNLLGLVLPLVATGILIFVVWSVLDTSYALEVTVKGETIGYIEDETVLEDAKAMLRGRLRLAGDQNMEDWKFDSTLTLSRTEGFTSKDQLVNAMLRSGTADIVEGTGLYMDGNLVAVTTEGKKLKEYLDGMLQQQEAKAEPDAVISFVDNVTCDPALDDVFLASSVQSYDDLIGELTKTVQEEVRYTAKEGDTLGEIARQNNLMFETLVARNPEYAGEDIDFEPDAGSELLIQRTQPFLQVQATVRQIYTEPIPFPVVEEETDQKAQGYRRVTQSGVDGVQEVQDDMVYIDGELVQQNRVEELTREVQAPVQQTILIGTFDVSNREMRDFAAVYTWPVPDYVYSSRGGGPGQGHRGRDINAPEGTPIYACNAGVVITAGWHYSYGNHVVIQHPDGLKTLYAHASYLAVSEGDVVQQNQYIANVGNTGNSFGNHLHLEFQSGGGLLNPDDYVVPPHGYGR